MVDEMTTTPPPSADAVEIAHRFLHEAIRVDKCGPHDCENYLASLIDQHTSDLRAQLAEAEEASAFYRKRGDELLAHAKAMRERLLTFMNAFPDEKAITAIKAFDDYMREK